MLKVILIEGPPAFVDPWDVSVILSPMDKGSPVMGQSIMFFKGSIPKMVLRGVPDDLDAAVDAARLGSRGWRRWLTF